MHLKFVWRIVELAYTGRSPEELARGFEPTATSIRNRLAQSWHSACHGEVA
jgi:hypothetical protein